MLWEKQAYTVLFIQVLLKIWSVTYWPLKKTKESSCSQISLPKQTKQNKNKNKNKKAWAPSKQLASIYNQMKPYNYMCSFLHLANRDFRSQAVTHFPALWKTYYLTLFWLWFGFLTFKIIFMSLIVFLNCFKSLKKINVI